MQQLLQNVSTGEISIEQVPAPVRDPASLLVATRYSLISAGTERAVLEVGRKSLVGKARARPDLVRKVVESARAEGLATTYAKVRGRLGQPNPLGYSLSGTVLEASDGAPASPGELVACAGAGHASHAEVVAVPRNLCARVPTDVAPEDAAYATVASIALHGVRLAEVGLGDVAVVIGLGLVGQLALDLLSAAGCVVLGIDPQPARVDLARNAGYAAYVDAGELEAEVARLTARRGADGVVIAAASSSEAPLATATAVARERAIVCIVGDVPISSPRAPLFAKELRVVVSRSYGPGRYDPTYEQKGIDYPPGYVRWTEGRNLEEVLRLMSTGGLRPSQLTTHVFDIADGARAYGLLEGDQASLGILLRYPEREDRGPRSVRLDTRPRRRSGHRLSVAVIGAGGFARATLMPALAREAQIAAVVNATGVSARSTATQFGAPLATTDVNEVLESSDVDAVVIATRHDTHAEYARRALVAGKHVFVEKPMALGEDELSSLEGAAAASEGILMVGFNRRFSPHVRRLRSEIGGHGPLVITYRVNAGRLPPNHWTHDPEVGGGRIVGEMVHFIDVAAYLCRALPISISASAVGGGSEPREDNVVATLQLVDGSVATIAYTAFGDPAVAKERIEVMGEIGTGVLDDFRELRLYRQGKEEKESGKRDKGHETELRAFIDACRTGEQPWPVDEMAAVTRASFAVRDRVRVSAPAW